MTRSAAIMLLAACAALPPMTGQASAQGYGYGYGYGQGRAHGATPCHAARQDRQLTGALVGGVLGGVAGGLIAEAGDDDDDHVHAYRHHGWQGHRGGWHRSRGVYAYHDGDDDSDVAAGVLLGALAGGLAGSALAGRDDPCPPSWPYADVPPPTRSATGPAWQGPPPKAAVPDRRHDDRRHDDWGHDASPDVDWPEDGWTDDTWGAPPPRTETLAGGPGATDEVLRECRDVIRETRLPDGRIVEDTVLACREGAVRDTPRAVYGDWEIVDR